MLSDRASVIASICELLSGGNEQGAADLVQQAYPFEPVAAVERKYGELEATRVFLRDGFIDRYSGSRLVFPGVLRVLSLHLPVEFPFHPNWKMSETHEAFWELSPTVDHVVPVSRGGLDSEANWVTTSMRRNSAKANWTLDELGWRLHAPGTLDSWDGLLGWFKMHAAANPGLLENGLVRRWYRAGVAAPHANTR